MFIILEIESAEKAKKNKDFSRKNLKKMYLKKYEDTIFLVYTF